MRERKIAVAQIERVIANPTRLSPSATVPVRLVAEYDTAAGNTLRVVYVEEQRTSGTGRLRHYSGADGTEAHMTNPVLRITYSETGGALYFALGEGEVAETIDSKRWSTWISTPRGVQ